MIALYCFVRAIGTDHKTVNGNAVSPKGNEHALSHSGSRKESGLKMQAFLSRAEGRFSLNPRCGDSGEFQCGSSGTPDHTKNSGQ